MAVGENITIESSMNPNEHEPARRKNGSWHNFDLEELLARGPIKIRVAAE